MIFLILKKSLKRGMKWRLVKILAINLISNGDKSSVQFPKTWKKVLKENQSDTSNLVLYDHQLLRNNRTLGIEKVNIPTSGIYFKNKLPLYNFQWKEINTLPRKVIINA